MAARDRGPSKGLHVLRIELFRSPKLKHLARALNIKPPYAAGLLGFMWNYACEQCPDGLFKGHAVEDIEDAAGWTRRRGAFVEACVSVGFIDDLGDGLYRLAGWFEYAPDFVKRKVRRRAGREASDDKDLQTECPASARPVASQRPVSGRTEERRVEESREEIPPLPPAGEGPAVKPPKPSSKSGRATWEQAWSAFCDGAALDARGAADYEYPTREWFEHKKSKGPLSERGWRALGRQVKTWGADRLRQAVDYSSSNGYQGLFEAKTNGKPVYQTEAPEMPTLTQLKERGLL